MGFPSETVVRDKLRLFATDQLSTLDFYQWVMNKFVLIEEAGQSPFKELILKIKLFFAEYTSGHLPEKQLREKVKTLLSTKKVEPRLVRGSRRPRFIMVDPLDRGAGRLTLPVQGSRTSSRTQLLREF